jgi:hypothetical protein
MEDERGEMRVNVETTNTVSHFRPKAQFLGFSGSSGPVQVTRSASLGSGAVVVIFCSMGGPISRSRRLSTPWWTSETDLDSACDLDVRLDPRLGRRWLDEESLEESPSSDWLESLSCFSASTSIISPPRCVDEARSSWTFSPGRVASPNGVSFIVSQRRAAPILIEARKFVQLPRQRNAEGKRVISINTAPSRLINWCREWIYLMAETRLAVVNVRARQALYCLRMGRLLEILEAFAQRTRARP